MIEKLFSMDYFILKDGASQKMSNVLIARPGSFLIAAAGFGNVPYYFLFDKALKLPSCILTR